VRGTWKKTKPLLLESEPQLSLDKLVSFTDNRIFYFNEDQQLLNNCDSEKEIPNEQEFPLGLTAPAFACGGILEMRQASRFPQY